MARVEYHALQSRVVRATPLLHSKLSAPRLPGLLVKRSRLLVGLDDFLAPASPALMLVQAPAGFGKTTLINEWIAERRSSHTQICFPPEVWISLDEGDNDPQRFWQLIITACQRWLKRAGQAIFEQLEHSIQPSLDAPPLRTVLTLLLNELAQQEQAGLLVLDNYHVIEETHIHETLAFFLDHLPSTFHVVLLSRTEPPLPLLHWRSRGEMYELHTADLRFSSEEMAAFLRQALTTPLSDAVLARLDAILEGWPAGLRLLALMLQKLKTSQQIELALASLGQHTGPTGSHQPLLNYFVTEILDAQPEPLQLFLLQTSVLTCLSAPLCEALTAREDSAALLESLERSGLFLEKLEGSGTWYRYHSLFAEALRHEATSRLGDEILWSLSLQASYWYEQHGKLEEAIETALWAADRERAAILIEQADARGKSWGLQTQRRWLEQMPEALLHAHPVLCLTYAQSLRFQEVDKERIPLPADVRKRIEVLLQMAEERWRSQGKLAEIGGIYAFRVLNALGQEPIQRVVEYARQALALLPEDDQDHLIQIGLGISLSFAGVGYLREGRFSEARQCILQAHACSLVSGDRKFTLSTVVMLGMVSLVLGELHMAAEYFRQVLSAAREQDDRENAAQALSGLAWLSFEWNNLAAAEQQAHEALALLSAPDQECSDRLAFQLALLQSARGQMTVAQQQFAALFARLQIASTPWSWWLLPDVLCSQARLHLATGDLQAVRQSLETLATQRDALDFVQRMRVQVIEARLLLAQGEAEAARLILERLLSLAQQRRMMHNLLEIQLLLALTYAFWQQKQESQRWLMQALTQAHSEGFLRVFLDEGEALASLLRWLLPTIQEKGLRSYVQMILRVFTLPIGEDTGNVSPAQVLLAEPLSAQERRVLLLLAAGCTNPQIAQELVISVNTVKHHLKQLYRKLRVSNRLEASQAARQLKLL